MSDIYLYVYDLSKGMAKQFSAMFLGKFICISVNLAIFSPDLGNQFENFIFINK
jgi:hypothetical protein